MAAGVVSGAAALLLEEQPGLKPAGSEAALQLTSSFMPEAGLIAVGAGGMNVLAAAEFVETGVLNSTTISGEQITDHLVEHPATRLIERLRQLQAAEVAGLLLQRLVVDLGQRDRR